MTYTSLGQPHSAPIPLFEPLGLIDQPDGPPRYIFRIGSKVRAFRAWEMKGITFLLELFPEADHWRALFPTERRSKIDTIRAAAHFMRLCQERGTYTPPESVPLMSDTVSK